MGRVQLAKARLRELRKTIRVCEKRREYFIKYLQEVKDQYLKRKISYQQYHEILHEKRNGKSIKEWIEYYEQLIKECEREINNHKHHVLGARTLNFLIIGLVSLVLISALFFLINSNLFEKNGFSITGKATQEMENKAFEKNGFIKDINEEFNETTNYNFYLDNAGVLGSLKLSGKHYGEGNIKIYFNGLLVFNNSNSKNAGGDSNKNPSDIESSSAGTNNTESNESNFNESNSIKREILEFIDVCEQTCDLFNLNISIDSSDELNLSIEVENSDLILDKIKYELIQEVEVVSGVEADIENNEILSEYIEIEKPVRWKKKIASNREMILNTTLPENVENITVSRIENGNKIDTEIKVNSIVENKGGRERKFERIESDYRSKEFEIEYYTQAPEKTEEEISKTKKIVKISAPDELNYTNVKSYTNIPEIVRVENKDKIKIYWQEKNSYVDFDIIDSDVNGFIDKVEWIVPHLSNQTFEIIIIIKAEHLDKNMNSISDIYEQVRSLDDIWSEVINENEYVRVSFETKLTNEKDITIYPRIVFGNPRIEVYEFNKTDLIAEFSSLNSNNYNKVYLTKLQNPQDTFDLKVLGGSVEFDYIVDPTIEEFFEDCSDINEWILSPSNGWAAGGGTCTSSNSADDTMTISFDLTGKTHATLIFDWTNNKLDTGEWFRVYSGKTNSSLGIIFQNQGNGGSQSGTQTINITSNISSTTTIRIQCLGSDGGENCDLDNINLTTFLPDTTPPELNITFPTNDTNFTATNIQINYTVSDSGSGLGSCWYTNTSGLVNYSLTCGNNLSSDWGLGINNITIYANDSVGNSNSSSVSFNVSVVSNTAPQIISVINSSLAGTNADPSENNVKNMQFNFTVFDADGADDIDVTTAWANFTRSGVQGRVNSSCLNTTQWGNYANFSCTIGMWYFDAPGVWNISVAVNDSSNEIAINSSSNFNYNQLQAIVISPTALSFNVNIGSYNQTPTNQPTLINNTGNYNVTSGNIQVKAINLHGQTITTDYISAGNFTASNNTGGSPPAECSGTALVNATDTGITNSVLGFGNHSENNNVTGQTRLFYCLNTVPTTVSSQTYSTSTAGAWVVKILAITVILKRKKKKIKDDRLTKALLLLADELKEKYSLNKSETMKIIVKQLVDKYKLKDSDLKEILEIDSMNKIPITIFSKNLGGLEAICKYMRENLGMSYHEIAKKLNRNDRTIWTAYKKSLGKQKSPLSIKETDILLPVNIFNNRKLTVLESAVIYLRDSDLKYKEIADLLNRNDKNMQTIYSRAVRKLKRNV